MNVEKMTVKAREAVARAQDLARSNQNQTLEPVHLLLSLLYEKEGVVGPLLSRIGANVGQIQAQAIGELDKLPKVSGGGQMYVSPALDELLRRADEDAKALTDEYTSTEHFILALIGDKGPVGRILRDGGVSRETVLAALKDVRGGQRITDENPEQKYQALEKYTRDLVALARAGKLDPVIGRDAGRPFSPRRHGEHGENQEPRNLIAP